MAKYPTMIVRYRRPWFALGARWAHKPGFAWLGHTLAKKAGPEWSLNEGKTWERVPVERWN